MNLFLLCCAREFFGVLVGVPRGVGARKVPLLEPTAMLIVMFARLLKMESERSEASINAMLTSNDSKKTLQEQFLICILSPSIPSYLDGLNDRISDLMEEKPEFFGLPKAVFDNPEAVKTLVSIMKELLTTCRGAMKQKLLQSLEHTKTRLHPQSIVKLSKSLVPKGMKIQKEHWARFAFLRSALKDFKPHFETSRRSSISVASVSAASTSATQVNSDADGANGDAANGDATYISTQFWNFIDDQLARVRDEAEQASPTKEGQTKWMNNFFNSVLQDDLKSYPGPKPITSRQRAPAFS